MMGFGNGMGQRGGNRARFCAATMIFLLGILGLTAQPVNKYADPVIREIHGLADRRDVDGLLPYLTNDNLTYRGEALVCLGSVQAIGIGDSILQAMQVDADGIRMMGAFALGQTWDSSTIPVILKALEKETSELVRGMLFEALGKCGSEPDLAWLAVQEPTFQETEGVIQGIFRFGTRGITSNAGNEKVTTLLETGTSQTGRIYAAYFLGRYANMDWLQLQQERMLLLFQNERDVVVASVLIKAVIRAMKEKAVPVVKDLLSSDIDYRVKVNTISTFGEISWPMVSKQVFGLVWGIDPNLSVASAEAIVKYAGNTDLRQLLKTIPKTGNWRSKSLLLGKAMELGKGITTIEKRVMKMMAEAMEKDPDPVRQSGYAKALALPAGNEMDEPEFIKQPPHRPIDWERVMQIPPKQRIAVVTNKGEFLVQLNVNWCPGTVSAFLELIDQGFFNNNRIHRVVPNFVVQDGSPRGDGSGGPGFTIRSEFSPIPFLEGTIGMASSGKDTEGSQWYVTHSPTPHLDGKYTNFGAVLSGMEVVHQLEVGDKIIRIERIGLPPGQE